MDLIKYHQTLEQQQIHMNAIKKMKPMIDTKPPTSSTYKHLNYRAKKQQLIDDRNQEIANENKKLMSRMTQIMTSSNNNRSNSAIKAASLVEIHRKHEIEKINEENKQMYQRLKKINPIIKVNKFENDFKLHSQFKSQIKRRELKPMSILMNSSILLLNSPTKQESHIIIQSNNSDINNNHNYNNNNIDLLYRDLSNLPNDIDTQQL